jgi:nicotinamidase/pyrazinamidase
MSQVLFWDVDTQFDFVYPDGRLYVPRAEAIVPRLGALTHYAHDNQVRVVASVELHAEGDSEFSATPDFDTTWPPHCIAGSPGQRKLPETALDSPLTIGPDRDEPSLQQLGAHKGDVLLVKRHFDVFTNPNSELVLRAFNPEVIVIYGLPLEICVRYVVEGVLARRPRIRLYVVTDAVKAVRYELGEHALRDWGDAGVRLIKTEEIVAESVLEPWLKQG